jgi:hypothetical protein
MWLWHTKVAEHGGFTKDEVHKIFKFRHVLPILIRDAENDALAKIYEACLTDAQMMEEFVDHISTTLLSTKQMSEALTEYDMWVADNMELVLPHPDDVYRDTIGQRNG